MSITHQTRWEWTTVSSLFLGYAGYYVCRSNLSVATPMIVAEYGSVGINKEAIGSIVSASIFVYALGKVFNSVLIDFVGGRRMFLFGMLASAASTVLFGLASSFGIFLVLWCVNRLVQSMGWSALVKITANWFSFARYGRVMGLLCLSYLVGDWLARQYFAGLLLLGFSWRQLFFAAAGLLAGLAVLCRFTVKSGPADVGIPEPVVNPANLFETGGETNRPGGIYELLEPFLKSPSFWLVCVMSLGLTIIRETFNFWLPTYLVEVGSYSGGKAAFYSSFYSLAGGAGVLLSGYITDKLGGRRGLYSFVSLVLLVGCFVGLWAAPTKVSLAVPLACIFGAGFLMMAPYAFLSGAISLDLGGKKGSSTAAGLVDAVGYMGASLVSGRGVGGYAESAGWGAVFAVMAFLAGFTALAALGYWHLQERARSPREI